MTSIITRSIDKPLVLNLNDVYEMEEVLMRTMQLEDVVKLHQERKFKQLVNILKATFATLDSKTGYDGQNQHLFMTLF